MQLARLYLRFQKKKMRQYLKASLADVHRIIVVSCVNSLLIFVHQILARIMVDAQSQKKIPMIINVYAFQLSQARLASSCLMSALVFRAITAENACQVLKDTNASVHLISVEKPVMFR